MICLVLSSIRKKYDKSPEKLKIYEQNIFRRNNARSLFEVFDFSNEFKINIIS